MMDQHACAGAVADPAEPDNMPTFDRIHAEFRPRIQRFLSRLVGAQDAEDLTQLVFVRVSQGLSGFRGDASLTTWIYRIARNAAADWRRTASRTAAAHQEIVVEVATATGLKMVIGSAAPEDALMRRDTQECLGRVVQELPEAYREVLTLRALDGLPNAAIANVLGLSLATVKVRLHRARGQLREIMATRCVVSRDSRSGLTCERKRKP
jgi:RNA polymerase sigma-70 factor, ECF subfamily